MKSISTTIAVLALAGALSTSAWDTQGILTDDTYINSADTTNNYGTVAGMHVRPGGVPAT